MASYALRIASEKVCKVIQDVSNSVKYFLWMEYWCSLGRSSAICCHSLANSSPRHTGLLYKEFGLNYSDWSSYSEGIKHLRGLWW